MRSATRARIGERLIQAGCLTPTGLETALNEQRRAHRPLGEVLVSLGFVAEADVARLVAEDLDLEFLTARDVTPDPVLVSGVDPSFVRATLAFPWKLEDGTLHVLIVDPTDPERVAAVRERFPFPLVLAVTTEADLVALAREHLRAEASDAAALLDAAARSRDDVPIERLTHALLLEGVHRGATDVHVEPDERVTRVRYRVDGMLVPGPNVPRELTASVVSRLKILAGLDISERRRPQNGRVRMQVDERDVDLRVSVMPCTDGENVVVRVLDRANGMQRLAALGLPVDHERVLREIAGYSHGLFLVTGPTGSGKTTTLYAMLAEVDAMARNVATIEDPVEVRLPLLRQSQVDPSIGFGFGEGLRTLLRQDPDVILVGEVRDHETADMALKASMTGHLVFSTLHTNSALAAVPRLVDLGIDSYRVEDALVGVLGQRLLRRSCRACAERVEPDEADVAWLGGEAPAFLVRSRGCERCGGSGYAGRTLIAELFLPDADTSAVIREGATLAHLSELARARGFRTMAEDGRRLVRAGVTTRAEVERVNKSRAREEPA